jgi:hypothetical protein
VSSLETFFLDGRNPELKRAALVLLREQETSELLRAAATSMIDSGHRALIGPLSWTPLPR